MNEMADFCVQCAADMGFPTDLANITTKEDWEKGLAVVVICEGCGIIQVDPDGNCISEDCLEKGHKK
jgi:RNase P subunit RPR2